ncbi:unnamed protein product [Rotaria sordida]|uniref:PDZ domain-containing protein n=1 Tax=Rotaria sordida TaxID=392033 RepID=A0A814BQY1_9BILA|nr:unnamed protein product [Rotaria sordida]
MCQELPTFDYKDHCQEEEIVLERSSNDNDTSLGFRIAGGNDQPFVENFTSIIVIHITENGLVDRDGRLKLYDIILRVNGVDYSNIKHQTAVRILKMSRNIVRLLIRRLVPQLIEVIELKHSNGKLGIEIAGGIGSEYFKGDYCVFIIGISNQINKQLIIGDRLIEISSAKNTYDLRFVTQKEAKKRIELACSDSQKVKLTISSHTRKLISSIEKSDVLHSEQYEPRNTKDEVNTTDKPVVLHQYPHDYRNEESITSIKVNKNNYSIITTKNDHYVNFKAIRALPLLYERTNEQPLIKSFDFEDYQRYENRKSLPSNVFTHHLSKLENLQLNSNHLHSLPMSFWYLTALRELNLSKNCFFTIPQAILNLTNLQLLDFSFNQITEIKNEIELLQVDELNLNNNKISKISTKISKCKRLKILRLDNNNLELKSIPISLLKYSTVSQLSVKGNRFNYKQFQLVEGYDYYEKRYTANQRKKD